MHTADCLRTPNMRLTAILPLASAQGSLEVRHEMEPLFCTHQQGPVAYLLMDIRHSLEGPPSLPDMHACCVLPPLEGCISYVSAKHVLSGMC